MTAADNTADNAEESPVETLPLFPLGTVLLPGLVLPLHIFEERYRRLVGELLELPADLPRHFGVVAIQQGREVGPHATTSLYDVGCTATVAEVRAYPDGRYDLMTIGADRFHVSKVIPPEPAGTPYLRAEVSWLAEVEGSAGDLIAPVQEALREYIRLLAERGARQPAVAELPEMPDEPIALSYFAAAALLVDTGTRQQLLAADDAASRLHLALTLLRRESGLLSTLPSVDAAQLSRQRFSPN
jgi:Lon protease-like protein